MPNENNLIIVTGLSGAGMSSALKALEDIGYEVLDNFPLSMMDDLLSEETPNPIAIGIDSRTRNFDPLKLKEAVKNHKAILCFMTCKHSVLQKRFTETRRKHPMAKDRPVSDGINKEIDLLKPLKDAADQIIDTTDLSIHDLRRMMAGYFAVEGGQQLSVTLTSFGFKNGVPRESDIVMDVRFLRNPHWDKDLKPLTGQNKEVAAYIAEDESFEDFIDNFKRLIEPLLARYTHEGKSYLTIAIGCTGGKHRSVFTVETLHKWLKNLAVNTHIHHRDMPV